MRMPEWVLYFLLIEISTAVSGSSWRASRSLPASMPSRPVTRAGQLHGDRLALGGVAADQHVLVSR